MSRMEELDPQFIYKLLIKDVPKAAKYVDEYRTVNKIKKTKCAFCGKEVKYNARFCSYPSVPTQPVLSACLYDFICSIDKEILVEWVTG